MNRISVRGIGIAAAGAAAVTTLVSSTVADAATPRTRTAEGVPLAQVAGFRSLNAMGAALASYDQSLADQTAAEESARVAAEQAALDAARAAVEQAAAEQARQDAEAAAAAAAAAQRAAAAARAARGSARRALSGWTSQPPKVGQGSSSPAWTPSGRASRAGVRTQQTQAVRTGFRRRCPGRRWRAPARIGKPTRRRRSAGAWATSRVGMVLRARPCASGRATVGTESFRCQLTERRAHHRSARRGAASRARRRAPGSGRAGGPSRAIPAFSSTRADATFSGWYVASSRCRPSSSKAKRMSSWATSVAYP